MGAYEDQIIRNAQAIQALIDAAKKPSELPLLQVSISPDDELVLERKATGEVVKVLVSSFSTSGGDGEKWIDGYWVNTIGNTDVNSIEVGNQIRGNITPNRYIIANVLSLPHTTETNLEIFLDAEK